MAPFVGGMQRKRVFLKNSQYCCHILDEYYYSLWDLIRPDNTVVECFVTLYDLKTQDYLD